MVSIEEIYLIDYYKNFFKKKVLVNLIERSNKQYKVNKNDI